ncbi:MAG TPA: DUF480 domain-containing protein [Lysobacter sp.]|jgi:uncharacterized protein YceH (UPF0502 family)|nr:DUF480 domain-containing protein [Lysobacter sp.]
MNDRPELPLLSATEARALGCLIEKETATPEAYPLTVNATVVAANQKTARDPVMSLNPGDVHHALRQLESRGLAKQTFSSRAERYEHRVGAALGLPAPQVALLGLLLLRGAQTAHELLARSERTGHLPDVEAVRHHLDRLIQRSPALAIRIPRGPGQREDRYMHLLAGPVDVEQLAAASAASRTEGGGTPALEARVATLEQEVAELREQLAALRDR